MGDKLMAKETVKKYNIPMVPGTPEAIDDINEALEISKKIGFPVLIKAAAGGGGKGMRVVEKAEDFHEQLDRAVSEAKSAFGNGAVFIEKYVTSPRHVEIQIMADNHGNIVYLFERECSVQRRHQKVVEEAPSAVLTPELRKEMGKCAVDVARACNYSGAGTVEFLLDADKNFYFLEMNTRLQVEHPVTEMITGIDLVEEQIRVASGEKLSFTQEDLKINGHAIELRVYAEDPTNNFLPDIGKLIKYKKPTGNFVRVDDGYEEGMDIPIYYDPMLAKLAVHGIDREAAITKMIKAIENYRIVGVETTLPFGRFVMKHEAFRSGNYDTHFVSKYFDAKNMASENEKQVAALFAAKIIHDKALAKNIGQITRTPSSWYLKRRSN
jgi:acetyl/propionyl-CoA carboxylase alpha subunit